MGERIAVIDMGTSTFHLLIAESRDKGYCIIHRDRVAVKIGKGGINQGLITEAGIQRALVAIQSFKNRIDQTGAQKVYAFATSALRNAKNKTDIVARIKSLTGIDVSVISGEQEATFIYEGVRAAVDLGSEKSLIMDIGGGSVEFIIGNQQEIFWKESFEIGAQRLLEKYQQHDPLVAEELELLNEHLTKSLSSLFDALRLHNPATLVGSSGTFDTLSDIFCIKYTILKTSDEVETPLTIEGFNDIYNDLKTKNRDERMRVPGMIEMRVDMIVVACALIKFILTSHPFNRIRVSTYSLKEGVLSWLGKKVDLLIDC